MTILHISSKHWLVVPSVRSRMLGRVEALSPSQLTRLVRCSQTLSETLVTLRLYAIGAHLCEPEGHGQ
jgi:hypothetical protein